MNLRHTKGVNIRALIFHVKSFIPIRCHLQAFVDREDAVPVKFCMGLIAIQFEKIRLVKGLGVGQIIPSAAAPVFYQPVRHCGDGQVAAVIGAEVPGAGILLRILPQGGADGPVLRGARREERFQISAENEFRTTLGRAVRIITAHRVIFPVAPDPSPVFIALVAGDVDHDFDAGDCADGLKHVDRTADIRVKGHFRFVVGEADEGLGSEVKNKFRLIFFESLDQPVEIADISMNMRYFLLKFRCFKIVGLAGGFEGIADDIRSQFLQPDRQPWPLKSGVAGDQNFCFFIGIIKQLTPNLITFRLSDNCLSISSWQFLRVGHICVVKPGSGQAICLIRR